MIFEELLNEGIDTYKVVKVFFNPKARKDAMLKDKGFFGKLLGKFLEADKINPTKADVERALKNEGLSPRELSQVRVAAKGAALDITKEWIKNNKKLIGDQGLHTNDSNYFKYFFDNSAFIDEKVLITYYGEIMSEMMKRLERM